MKTPFPVGLTKHLLWMAAAVLMHSTLLRGQTTYTWDINSGTTGVQNGNGNWNTTDANWLVGGSNTTWVNSATAIAEIGGGTATSNGSSSAPTTITIQTDLQLDTLNFRGFTVAPTSFNQYTLNGDVAGRLINFGTDGLIQMEDRSSGGSQFVSLGGNLRIVSSNLRVQKYGTGTSFQYLTLSMSTNPNLTGTFTIAGSIYATITVPNTLQVVDRIVVEAGGTAALSGAGLNYTQPFSIAGMGNSLAFSGTAYGALRLVSNNLTLSGPITLTADAGIQTNFSGSGGFSAVISGTIGDDGKNYSFNRFAFTRSGDSVVVMTGANTYGGATILGRNVAAYSGGTTVLDFSAAGAPQNNILYNGLSSPGNLVLASGNSATTLRLTGKAGLTNSQAFKDLSVSGAYNVIELASGLGGTVTMSIGNISRVETTAMLAVIAPISGGISTTQAAGFQGPWMTFTNAYGARSWGQVAGGMLAGAYAGDSVLSAGQSLGAAPFTAASNMTLTHKTTGSVSAVAGTSDMNTLSVTDITLPRTIALGAGQTLRLGTQGGVQLLNGAQDLTVGSSAGSGSLTAGGSTTNTPGILYLSNLSHTGALVINSNIVNNGTSGTVTLQQNNAPGARTVLTGTNTHTGGTLISSGILEIRNASALGTSGTVTVLDGATLALSGNITLSRALAAMNGFGDGGNGALRSLSGTNTYAGALTQLAPSLLAADAGATLNFSSASTIGGAYFLTFGGAGTINVAGVIGAVSGFVKTGSGTLVLSGANTYASTVTVNQGVLRLGSATTLPTAATLNPTGGGVVDLNGLSVSTGVSMSGAGQGYGALISSNGAATLTGTAALTAATLIGGTGGDITINNTGGLTGNVLLTKIGSGTLTVIGTTTSARSGTNQIDAGVLRIQSSSAIAPVGTGSMALNGGTLSLGFDASGTVGGVVNLLSNSTIIADRATSGIGSTTSTLSTLTISNNTLTVKAGSNVTSGTIGLTVGTTSFGGSSMRGGNPTFDVQSNAVATTTLTLGALTDLAIAARTITFQNTASGVSVVNLNSTASSLVDGTVINLASGSGAVNMSVGAATGIGALTRVNVDSGNTMTAAANSIVLGALNGSGNVTAGASSVTLTVGNVLNATTLDSTFSGVIANNGAAVLSLTKSGKGTLTLNGSTANSYSGTTTVNAGTLVLAKTGGAAALGGGALTIGASTTVGNATVRLEADNPMTLSSTSDLTMNAGATLDLNGYTLNLNTISTLFGANITGNGTLMLNRTSGTNTYNGINTISSTLQLTTLTSGIATRTVAVTGVADRVTFSGSLTDVAGAAGSITKTLLGTLVLSGDNSYTGLTTISAGMINIRHANALGSTGTGAGTTVSSGATLQIQGGITTAAEATTISGTGFAGSGGSNYQTGALVNVSGTNAYAGLITLGSAATISSDSGTLNLTHTGTLSGAALALTLAGAGDGSIASVIGNTTGGIVKNGTGTWTLTGLNTATGVVSINAGKLRLGNGSTGGFTTAVGLTYTGSGTFEYAGASTQAMGALTLSAGAGTLSLVAPPTGSNTLTFTSLAASTVGAALNVVADANAAVMISGLSVVNGVVSPRVFYNGSNFATAASGYLSAANTTAASASLTSTNTLPYLVSGAFSQTTSETINVGMKFASNSTLTLNNGILLTINNGANTPGALLITGGANVTFANQGSATGLTTAGSGDLIIRTDGLNDSLNLQVPVGSSTTGGLTKVGRGTLTLSASNAYTGSTNIGEGTVVLGSASALSSGAVTVRVGGALNLSGYSATNAMTLNGTGPSGQGALVNSTGTATVGALTIDTGLGTGSVGASVGGAGNITTTGALAGTGMLVKTGSGTLTVGNNNGTAVASTRTASTRIDDGVLRIRNSSTALGAASAQIILNGGTLSLGTASSVAAYPVTVSANSGIITDNFAAGVGVSHTLGALIIGGQTLTITSGSNVTTAGSTPGLVFGSTTLQGNAVFDVQSPTAATNGTTTLTLGALTDLGVPRSITFQNSGSASMNGIVTLATAATSLMEGTQVSVGSKVTLNLAQATALGSLAQVDLANSATLNVGAAATIASMTGTGTISASGTFTLTIGNANSATVYNQTFSGSLVNGSGTLSLTKGGLGTLTLTPATSSYSGTTTVSAGILKLGSNTALGATSGVTISVGGTLDLNGMTTDRSFTSVSGIGHTGLGAIINTSSTAATITGSIALGAASKIGGSGDIIISNSTGLTGNVQLTKVGSGTLTFISSGASARNTSGTNQIDEGTLRLQSAVGQQIIGAGPMTLNGGTLSLGFDSSGTVGGGVNVLANSTIITDRASAGAGGITSTLGSIIISSNTLTVKAGANVTSGIAGLTLGSLTSGGPSLAPGNPVFDVQSTAAATTVLTIGALSDQAIAPRTYTFQNSGSSPSSVVLASAATSLLNGTLVNLANTGGAVTLNLNNATALGSVAQVNISTGNTLALGTSHTLAGLSGEGNVSATANATLTIGTSQSLSTVNSTFNGTFTSSSLSVTKAGNGTLTLGGSGSNTLGGVGGLAVNTGTLVLAKTGGAVAVPTKLTVGTVGAVNGSATVRLDEDGQISSSAQVVLNAQGTLDLNGHNTTLGMLLGAPGSSIANNGTGTAIVLTVGAGNVDSGHLGYLVDNTSGTGTLAVTKTGSGSFLMGGLNSYTGATTVTQGTLQVGVTGMGTTGLGAVTLANTTTLLGTGIVQGSSFTAANGSQVFVGDSLQQSAYGTLTFKPQSGSGVLDFQSGSTVTLGINASSGVSDLISFIGTGSTSVVFQSNLNVTADAFVPTATQSFKLLDWSGLTSTPQFAGRFSTTDLLYGNGDEAVGLDLPDVFGSGYGWDLSQFMTTGTLALVLVPEPSRCMLLGLAIMSLGLRRRRR